MNTIELALTIAAVAAIAICSWAILWLVVGWLAIWHVEREKRKYVEKFYSSPPPLDEMLQDGWNVYETNKK